MISFNRQAVRGDLILPAFMALLITMFLFYIDEGKYNFEGIFRLDNLFALMVFAIIFFGFQLVVQIILEQFIVTGKSRRIISIVLSTISLPLALVAFLWIVKAI
jgi:hypothetical protein